MLRVKTGVLQAPPRSQRFPLQRHSRILQVGRRIPHFSNLKLTSSPSNLRYLARAFRYVSPRRQFSSQNSSLLDPLEALQSKVDIFMRNEQKNILRLFQQAQEYNAPSKASQKLVLGDLYKRPWPIKGPTLQQTARDSTGPFQFSMLPEDCNTQHVHDIRWEFSETRTTMDDVVIFPMVELSGYGKTHRLLQFSNELNPSQSRGPRYWPAHYLLHFDTLSFCDNALKLLSKDDKLDKGELAAILYTKTLLVDALYVDGLVRNYPKEAHPFLVTRLLINGGRDSVETMRRAFSAEIDQLDLLTSTALCKAAILSITNTSNRDVIVGIDESSVMLNYLQGEILMTVSNEHQQRRRVPSSLFTVPPRVHLTLGVPLFLLGTSLTMRNVAEQMSSAAKSRIHLNFYAKPKPTERIYQLHPVTNKATGFAAPATAQGTALGQTKTLIGRVDPNLKQQREDALNMIECLIKLNDRDLLCEMANTLSGRRRWVSVFMEASYFTLEKDLLERAAMNKDLDDHINFIKNEVTRQNVHNMLQEIKANILATPKNPKYASIIINRTIKRMTRYIDEDLDVQQLFETINNNTPFTPAQLEDLLFEGFYLAVSRVAWVLENHWKDRTDNLNDTDYTSLETLHAIGQIKNLPQDKAAWMLKAGLVYGYPEDLGKTKFTVKAVDPVLTYFAIKNMQERLAKEAVGSVDVKKITQAFREYITLRQDYNKKHSKPAGGVQGRAAEMFLALTISQLSWAKDYKGRPITDIPLFSQFKGTYLDHYALEDESSCYYEPLTADRKCYFWLPFLDRKRRFKIAFLPRAAPNMPDIIFNLKLLSSSDTEGNKIPVYWEDEQLPEFIPATVSVKFHRVVLEKNIEHAFKALDAWTLVDQDHHQARSVLDIDVDVDEPLPSEYQSVGDQQAARRQFKKLYPFYDTTNNKEKYGLRLMCFINHSSTMIANQLKNWSYADLVKTAEEGKIKFGYLDPVELRGAAVAVNLDDLYDELCAAHQHPRAPPLPKS